MKNDDQPKPGSNPGTPDPTDRMLERLPAVYAGWERDTASAELERIRKRVEELGRGDTT